MFALASEAKVQASLYPDGTCKGDELVLDFDNCLRALRKEEISDDQNQALDKLDQLIALQSGEQSGGMFLTDEALSNDSKWEEIRAEAKKVIDVFGWGNEPPQKNGATYILHDGVIENK